MLWKFYHSQSFLDTTTSANTRRTTWKQMNRRRMENHCNCSNKTYYITWIMLLEFADAPPVNHRIPMIPLFDSFVTLGKINAVSFALCRFPELMPATAQQINRHWKSSANPSVLQIFSKIIRITTNFKNTHSWSMLYFKLLVALLWL